MCDCSRSVLGIAEVSISLPGTDTVIGPVVDIGSHFITGPIATGTAWTELDALCGTVECDVQSIGHACEDGIIVGGFSACHEGANGGNEGYSSHVVAEIFSK